MPVPEVETGYLELNVGIGDFKESTGTEQTEQEAAVKNLSLFLFYPDGREMLQTDRQHVVKDGKISTAIPEEAMGQELSVYLVANEAVAPDGTVTEEELLQYKTTRSPDDFISNGFPMTTERISVRTDEAKVSAAAVLQRVPSALYAQVEETTGAEGIRNNSYKIEIEGLQLSEGALFQDVAASVPTQGKTDYSTKLTAVNTPENLAYFYQSENITIHITPYDSNYGKEKVITIDNTKSIGRNKRFLLKIMPIKSTGVTRSMDFTIQVAEWETEVIVVEMPSVEGEPLDSGLLFAEGVSLESGWYDLNKSWGKGGFSYDSRLCWAATCTNMIQWWQDRYVADGGVLQAGTPNGFTPGRENETMRQLAVFEKFAKVFPNEGNNALTGLAWYFPTFLPYLFPTNEPFMQYKIVKELDCEYKQKSLKEFSDFVINGFKQRGVFFLATSTGTGSHARTVWGCKYNPVTGIIDILYLTDSDDDKVIMWLDVPLTQTDGVLKVGPHRVYSISVLYAYPKQNG